MAHFKLLNTKKVIQNKYILMCYDFVHNMFCFVIFGMKIHTTPQKTATVYSYVCVGLNTGTVYTDVCVNLPF